VENLLELYSARKTAVNMCVGGLTRMHLSVWRTGAQMTRFVMEIVLLSRADGFGMEFR
jgi:hypothetical protein